MLEPAKARLEVFDHQFTDKTELLIVLLDEVLAPAGVSIDDVEHPADPWTPPNVAVDAYDRLLAMVDDHEDLVRIQLREASHPDPLVRKPLAGIGKMWITSLSSSFQRLSSDAVAFDADMAASWSPHSATASCATISIFPRGQEVVSGSAASTARGVYGVGLRRALERGPLSAVRSGRPAGGRPHRGNVARMAVMPAIVALSAVATCAPSLVQGVQVAAPAALSASADRAPQGCVAVTRPPTGESMELPS